MFDFFVKRLGPSCIQCAKTQCSDFMIAKWGPELRDRVGASANLAAACGNYRYDAKRASRRFVFGTEDEMWHLVGEDDRDFVHGITQDEMSTIGEVMAKDKYLGARRLI